MNAFYTVVHPNILKRLKWVIVKVTHSHFMNAVSRLGHHPFRETSVTWNQADIWSDAGWVFVNWSGNTKIHWDYSKMATILPLLQSVKQIITWRVEAEGWCHCRDSLFESRLSNSNFVTWLLLVWQHSCHPTKSLVRKKPPCKQRS